MKTTNWAKVLIMSSIGLLALVLILNLFAPLLWWQFGGWGYNNCFGFGDWGMMRGGGGSGMMGYYPFGGLGMLIGLLFPLGLLALLVAGIVWLVQAVGRSGASRPVASPTHACAHCGQPIQANWRNCPYCGAPLVETQSD